MKREFVPALLSTARISGKLVQIIYTSNRAGCTPLAGGVFGIRAHTHTHTCGGCGTRRPGRSAFPSQTGFKRLGFHRKLTARWPVYVNSANRLQSSRLSALALSGEVRGGGGGGGGTKYFVDGLPHVFVLM